jgi:hypothetical protein
MLLLSTSLLQVRDRRAVPVSPITRTTVTLPSWYTGLTVKLVTDGCVFGGSELRGTSCPTEVAPAVEPESVTVSDSDRRDRDLPVPATVTRTMPGILCGPRAGRAAGAASVASVPRRPGPAPGPVPVLTRTRNRLKPVSEAVTVPPPLVARSESGSARSESSCRTMQPLQACAATLRILRANEFA